MAIRTLIVIVGWVGMMVLNIEAVQSGMLPTWVAATVETAYIFGGALWASGK